MDGVIVFKKRGGGAYSFRYVWLASFTVGSEVIEVHATSSLKQMLFVRGNAVERMSWKKGLEKVKELFDAAGYIEVHPDFYLRYRNYLLDKNAEMCYNINS